MKEPVPYFRPDEVNSLSPVRATEEPVEIFFLVRMTDKSIDLLVHESDEHLATRIAHDLGQYTKGHIPSEGIDESERRRQAALTPFVTVECATESSLKIRIFDLNGEIVRQRGKE
jgi:hypothetical protein